jgi:hypothetical protein
VPDNTVPIKEIGHGVDSESGQHPQADEWFH